MKYGIKCDGKPKFFIKYTAEEWTELKKRFELMGLEEKQSDNLWGKSIKGGFFKENDAELKMYLQNTTKGLRMPSNAANYSQYVDDINQPFVNGQYFNLGIFRAVPDSNLRIEIPITRYFTILEVNEIGKVIAAIYQMLFNISVDQEMAIERKE